MSDESPDSLAGAMLGKMPPWAWPLLYVCGGGSLAAGGMKLSLSSDDPLTDACEDALERAEKAEESHRQMMVSLQTIAGLLGECSSGE